MEPAEIRAILAMLDESAGEVHGARIDNVPTGRFGGSDSGATFASHASLAHQMVAEAMADMVTGLHGYRDNIATYSKNQFGVDDTAGDDLNRIQSEQPVVKGINDSAGC